MAVALTVTSPVATLVEEGRLAPELVTRFGDGAEVVLPGLRDRPEDLRSIFADRLAREGLRVRGRPIGIEASAFARLIEHPFEGEDAELSLMVSLLVARVEGDVVRASDIEALGMFEETATRSGIAKRS
jgi:DNA-binding NtrC family response regulator